MKFLVVLAALVAVAACWSVPSEEELASHWQAFKAAHAKNYPTAAEEGHRMNIFKENAIKVARHNARFDAGAVSFKVGINKHSDLLSHEVAEMLNGLRPSMHKRGERPLHNVSEPLGWPWPWNKSVDWRDQGYVTNVKNQGECRCGWAFSTAGSLEGALYKKNGTLVSLSAQNLVDCSIANNACKGGVMDLAFMYIIKNGGIDTEASYPYTGEAGKCKFSKNHVGGTLVSYVDIEEGSESALQDAVKKVGPVSVGINANHWTFHNYESGIYYDESCNSEDENVDHGALVVGYGSAGKNQDYWIVKNSWGTKWGENGYIRIARNKKNHCGIASMASYPVV